MALIAGKSIQDNSMYRIYITIHFKDILTHVDAELLKLSDSLPHTHKHTHTHTHKLYSLGAVCFWKVQSTINITDTSSFLLHTALPLKCVENTTPHDLLSHRTTHDALSTPSPIHNSTPVNHALLKSQCFLQRATEGMRCTLGLSYLARLCLCTPLVSCCVVTRVGASGGVFRASDALIQSET